MAVESYDEDDAPQEKGTLEDGPEGRLPGDRAIDNFLQPLVIEDAKLYQLACCFSKVYEKLAKTSDQQFLPTPVTRLPTGQETGRYLAIDVGGSNLRVAFIDLLGEAADQIDGESDEEKSRETFTLPGDRAIDNFFTATVIERMRSYTQLACCFSKVYEKLAKTSRSTISADASNAASTGQETGRYLAIDVGGSNLRVAFIDLLGEAADQIDGESDEEKSRETLRKAQRNRVRRSLEKAWPIEERLKTDKAEDLFLWIGDCMAEVVADSLTAELADGAQIPEELEMGITFSFPMMQESLSEAILMPMGKGFKWVNSTDLNLGKILLAGYERHTRRPYGSNEPSVKRRKLFALPKLKIAAITNDTVATLASLAYLVKSLPNSRVAMGISHDANASETIVNTEWTINGAAPPLRELNVTTVWDSILDSQCARPGFQPFEYMTGGRYIGELVRIIFYDYLTSVVGLPKKDLPAILVQGYALSTTYLSSVVANTPSDSALAAKLGATLPPPESSSWNWDVATARAFRKVARAVQTRSAALIASAVVGLLACNKEIKLRHDGATNPRRASNIIVPEFNASTDTLTDVYRPKISNTTNDINNSEISAAVEVEGWQSGPEELVVAYTGGIIQHYPHFKEACQSFIDRLVIWDGPQESGKSVFLREASDGGIIGAGVLAGMVSSS
ncbi:hexokinase-2 [Coccidioides immitis RMSCC 3703]|uniref:Hexokinase-2 n=1 Tax=Coccidioides immitis RMSCC 3703 TaxID=454286 RepID=A0A0J8RBJ3_COCIT|nr:hexokinase-2 [Coccidioides immitis RMSCC 3703]